MLYFNKEMIAKIIKTKKWLFLIFLLAVGFILTHRFFFMSGDFNTHDGVHFIRLYNLEKIFKEGQFPPRWLPDLGKGYGYPFFNFYPPLAYFAGLVFRLLGASFTFANKLSFGLAGLIGLGGMFFLAKNFFGFWGGAGAALFWLFLPYRAVDLYVRGSLAEYWGLNLLPVVFYLAKRLFDRQSVGRLLLFIISLFLLLIAHNAVALIGIIWLIGFIIYLFFTDKGWSLKKIKKGIFFKLSFFWALGLAAFFVIPAIWEKSSTQIADMTNDYYAYYNHFPSLAQLFISRFWGYGGSNFGLNDEMSFQIGHLHWISVLLALPILAWNLVVKKLSLFKQKKNCLMALFFGGSFFLFAFLAHQRSLFIWQRVGFLAFLQFPWRLLIFIGFSASILAGYLMSFLKKKFAFLIFIILFLILGGLSFNYFQPKEIIDRNDHDYLSSPLWEYQQREFITDYLPKTVREIPKDYYSWPLVVNQEAKINLERDQADKIIFTASSPDTKQTALIKRFYFPGWEAVINQEPVDIDINNNGFMILTLPKGEAEVELAFKNTPIRQAANAISLTTWFLFLIGALAKKYWQKKINLSKK